MLCTNLENSLMPSSHYSKFSDKEIEEWAIESEDDIQVNCILQDLIPSALPMSAMQKETANDQELQELKEEIINNKKCRKTLTSCRGIFGELSYTVG